MSRRKYHLDGRRRSVEPESTNPAALVAVLVLLALALVGAGGWAIWHSEQSDAALAEAARELEVAVLEAREAEVDCPGSANCYYRSDGSIMCDCLSVYDGDTGIGWPRNDGPQHGYLWYNLEVAELPASCTKGQTYAVVDGQTASDCSVGGGGLVVQCICVGDSYAAPALLVSE